MDINYLSLTCGLHYLSILPFILKNTNRPSTYYNIYINTILLSTTFGIIWHYYNKFMIYDYIFTGIWFVEDLFWSLELNNYMILNLNIIIFVLNIIINYIHNYVFYHSIWHILSAIKCIYISNLILSINYRLRD